MKRRGRMLSLLCAAALAIGLLLPGLTAAADEVTVYQTSVNNKLLPLETESMPAVVNGLYYVPCTVFDRNLTGVNLGVSYGQWKTESEHTLTLYSLGSLITFDLNAGTCMAGSGEKLNMRAILRNGKVYVPLNGVCTFFGLGAAHVSTPYGTLVRITNDRAVLSTERFVDVASNRMRQQCNAYLRSIMPAASPSPSPSASAGPGGPEDPPVEDTDKRDVQVLLAFRCGSGQGLEQILDTLDEYGVQALFCFRTEDLIGLDEYIRRAVGGGHTVGLLVPEDMEGEALTAYLQEGSGLLARIAHLPPHILMAETDGGALAGPETDGWALWTGNIDGTADDRGAAVLAEAILSEADARSGLAAITMDDTAAAAGALSRMLPDMREVNYSFRAPVETELS